MSEYRTGRTIWLTSLFLWVRCPNLRHYKALTEELQAGLFSSVVAGFTVESYSWLEQDNSDVSVQLLAQISAQLASFSVSQGHVNSTVVPVPLAVLAAPNPPSEMDVRINTLWFLSLAISLTASLLAIMVQQWLREYRIPGHLSIRERVRLRQYRYDALKAWDVPMIVSVLPILLQIALVLFLLGLCYLLKSLDKTVAKAFIAFVGIALSAYFAFTVLPIASRHCPYKSPFAHGIITVFKLLCVIAIVGTSLIAVLMMLLSYGVLASWNRLVQSTEQSCLVWLYKVFTTLLAIIPRIANASNMREHEYWTSRDLDAMQTAKHLDRKALIWAPAGLSKPELTRMDRCLSCLPEYEQMLCVCAWVTQALNTTMGVFSNGAQEISSFDSMTLAKIDHSFSNRFRHSLLRLMPDKLAPNEDKDESYASSMLVVLRHIAKLRPADPDWIMVYARRVFKIRDAQTPADLNCAGAWTRLPTSCLFELSTTVQYDFSAEGMTIAAV